MALLTYSELRDKIESDLGDSSNAIWTTAVLDNIISDGLTFIARYVPWETSVLKSLAASSRELTLTAGDKWKAIEMSGPEGYYAVEYEVDKDPKQYRNFVRRGDTLTLKIADTPSAASDVRIFIAKKHILQSAIGTSDTAGAVKTAGAKGDTTLALKSLGSDTINEDTKLTIAGDTTEYNVYATATIAANEATVSIWPPLQAACLADAVVTLALHDSTLTPALETALCEWVEAKALMNLPISKVNAINVGSNVVSEYRAMGQDKMALVLRDLESLASYAVKKNKLFPDGSEYEISTYFVNT